jgi:hypothetical protein
MGIARIVDVVPRNVLWNQNGDMVAQCGGPDRIGAFIQPGLRKTQIGNQPGDRNVGTMCPLTNPVGTVMPHECRLNAVEQGARPLLEAMGLACGQETLSAIMQEGSSMSHDRAQDDQNAS